MLHCFPTTDVHLLTAAGRNLPIDLYLFAQWPPQTAGATWTDLSTVPQLQIGAAVAGGNAVVAVASHVPGNAAPVAGPTFTVTPNGVGTTMGQTTVSHPTVPLQPADRFRLMRLTVHADVDRFWIPIGSVTMFAGESNRVLPITAIFDDQSQADATGHPYWSYGSSDRTVAVVDADGRVRARKAGTTTITVTLIGTQKSQAVNATVLPPLADGYSAKVIPWGSVAGDRARVYVISEGYDNGTRFEDHFKQIVDRWFATPENRPFDLLRDRYAVFGISDLVGKPGITIGPVLGTQARAEPTTIQRADLTLPLRVADERDTRFGLIYGARMCDPEMRQGSPATPEQWLKAPRAHRAIGVDWRRVEDVHADPGATFMSYLRRYLAAVALKASNMPEGFGVLTAEDRVIILCDDQLRGGLLLAVAGILQRERLVVSASAGSDAGFDHVAASAGEPRRFDRTVSYVLIRSAVASTVVHEIGHTYRLHDEYEEARGRAPTGAAAIAALEPYENVQLLDELLDPVLGLRADRIKWNLPRMVQATGVAEIIVSNLRVGMAIAGADKLAWITPGAKLMLRPTLRHPRSGPGTPRLPLYEVTVTSVSAAVVDAQSFVPVPEPEFAGGGVLYQPMLDTSGPIKLIYDSVASDLGVNGVFPKPPVRVPDPDPARPGPCFDQDPNAPFESVDARAIVNGPTTPDRWRIIGLYEGGFGISCGIGRPTGRCKLRRAFDFTTNTVWRFCPVCQYVIVDLVDPSQHARLDKDYPP